MINKQKIDISDIQNVKNIPCDNISLASLFFLLLYRNVNVLFTPLFIPRFVNSKIAGIEYKIIQSAYMSLPKYLM